ncbi:unnamed protein product [Rhizophagus irregularis]|nr:unnamed protein product [Rhizophagus irregularis]
MINDFLNKVKVYVKIFNVYGITQYPDSKDYIIVLHLEEYVKEFLNEIKAYSMNNLNGEIKKQFKEAEEYRKINFSSIEINQSTTHPQASNISRLLNPFTEDLSKCDNDSECLDCSITD